MCDEKLKEIAELEKLLDYFIKPEMNIDTKIKVLSDSFWRSHSAGYCDYMAGRRMAGVEDEEVCCHNFDWKYRWEVERLADLLTEQRNEEFAELWQKASDLFDADNEAGCKAWLALYERGYARAAHTVGWCYRFGRGVEQNLEKSEEYYRLAINGGFYKSYEALYWVYEEKKKPDEAMEYLLKGIKLDDASCYETLAMLCDEGKVYGGNAKVSAYLAARAYELDKKYGMMLALYYINGRFFPQVYPYAKYCLENSSFTRADLVEMGVELPEYWDEIEPIEPKYPAFDITTDTCGDIADPDEQMQKARELIYGDVPDKEAAKPYVLEAAKAGNSQAMYYTYLLDIDGCEDFLTRGADEYGDIDCIETAASLFTQGATYKIGNQYLNLAVHYWNLRKKLHGKVPMDDYTAELYEGYSKGLDIAFGRAKKESDPAANAVLLRADGSYEKIKVDFTTTEGLYAPLGCERVNAVSTQKLRTLSAKLGFTVVMYCDERGMQKHLAENYVASTISGYDIIFGDVVICGFKNDYAPLYKDEVEAVFGMLLDF